MPGSGSVIAQNPAAPAPAPAPAPVAPAAPTSEKVTFAADASIAPDASITAPSRRNTAVAGTGCAGLAGGCRSGRGCTTVTCLSIAIAAQPC